MQCLRSVMEATFTSGESSEDVLENVCFMVLGIKKRRANTKIGATFTSFWFMYQTLYKCYRRSPLFGHLLSSDTFFRALHFDPGRSRYDFFFLVNSLSTDIRHYRNTFYNLAKTIIFTYTLFLFYHKNESQENRA